MAGVLGLEHVGIDPFKDDIRFLVIGDQVVIMQALEDGRIDATVLDTVFSKKLQQKGFPILAEFQKTNLPITSTSVVARSSYIQKNGRLMEGFIESLFSRLLFSRSGQQRRNAQAAATAPAGERARSGRGIDGHADRHGQKAFSVLGWFAQYPAAYKELRNPKLGSAKVEDLVDDRILRRLDASGYIDKLFATYGVK